MCDYVNGFLATKGNNMVSLNVLCIYENTTYFFQKNITLFLILIGMKQFLKYHLIVQN